MTFDPCAQSLLLTGARLRPARSYSPYKARQTWTAKTTKKSTNEFRDKSTSKCDEREEITVPGVCVMLGTGSPLESLVTLVSWQQAQPTNPTTIREEQTSNTRQEQSQQTQQRGQTRKGQQTTHQKTHRQRSGQRRPKNEQERGGRQWAEASSSRTKKRGPGGSKDRRRKQHRPRRRAHASDVIGTKTTVVCSPYGPTYLILSFHQAATIGQWLSPGIVLTVLASRSRLSVMRYTVSGALVTPIPLEHLML